MRSPGVARALFGLSFVDHRPAVEVENELVVLVVTPRAHPDDADVALRGLALGDDLGFRAQRVSGKHGYAKTHICVAEVGGRIQRHVRNRSTEDDVEDQQVVNDFPLEAECAPQFARTVQRPAITGQCDVEREVALGNGPGNRVVEDLAAREIFEEVAVGDLGGGRHRWSSQMSEAVFCKLQADDPNRRDREREGAGSRFS